MGPRYIQSITNVADVYNSNNSNLQITKLLNIIISTNIIFVIILTKTSLNPLSY